MPKRNRIPPCAAEMGCLCAGHARGNPPTAPCDTTEIPSDEATVDRALALYPHRILHSEPDGIMRHHTGVAEIQLDAQVSRAIDNSDHGAYVAAWVWVPDHKEEA